MKKESVEENKMKFKTVKLRPSLFKEMRKEGFVSIECMKYKEPITVSLYDEKNEDQEKKTMKLKELKKLGKEGSRKRKTIEVTNDDENNIEINGSGIKKLKKTFLKRKSIDKLKIKERKENLKKKKRNEKEKNINKENINKKKKIITQKKKTNERKLFDIVSYLKNEQHFQKLEDHDFQLHIQKWTKKGKISISYNILKSLYDNEFFNPYEIQSKTLMQSIKRKKDIIVISKTGTGKTLTFCLPILNNILSTKLKEYEKNKKCISKLRCLMLVPTRELALQIVTHFGIINKYINIFLMTLIGGINTKKQERLISKKPEIIICTPGRLRYFLESEESEHNYITNMKHVRYFVCDELDKMVETSFTVNIKIITKHLYDSLGEKVKYLQTYLSSATLGLCAKIEKDKLTKLIHYINIRPEKSFLINLSEASVGINNNCILPEKLTLNIIKSEKKTVLWKLFYLLRFYFFHKAMPKKEEKEDSKLNANDAQKIIVFANTIVTVKELKKLFSLLFFDANLEGNVPKKFKTHLTLKKKVSTFCIHSKLEQKKRIESIDKFVQCKNHAIIFCTDVLSRGIDLHNCDLIIQLNCPVTDITFVHRSGRTARSFKQGLCICFIDNEEIANWKCAFNKIGLNLDDIKENEDIKKLKGYEYQKLAEAFKICKEIQELEKNIIRKKESYIDKLAKEADLFDDDDSSNSASPYDAVRELGETSRKTIFKKIRFLKKQVYRLLYSTT